MMTYGELKMKSVIINHEPFNELKAGVDAIANVVKATLGPRGKNVLIDKKNKVISTRDGVSVAKMISFKDNLKNMGALLIREAASKTNKEAGDGTTTATVIAQALFHEALKDIYSGNTTPLGLKEEIESSVATIVSLLKDNAKQIESYEDVYNIAVISANNDPVIGKLIADAVHKVGEKGTIIVETGAETGVSFQEGLTIDRGLSDCGPAFITNAAKICAEFDKPYICVIDDNIDSIEYLLPILEYVKDKPIVLCVSKIEDTVLGVLAKNKLNNKLNVAVIKTPGHNNYEIIEDFALAVDATIINPDYHSIDEFSPDDLGLCDKAIINLEDSTFVNGAGNVDDRVAQIKDQIENMGDGVGKVRLQDRINKLINSIAVLKISADSDTELLDKKLRIEDAINASKAAMSEGIIEGGGTTLMRISERIDSRIVRAALKAPFRCIVENSGEIPEVILSEMEATDRGYNAKTGKIENLFEAGVIDPVKVTRTALQKAASIAVILLTTGPCVVREDDNE